MTSAPARAAASNAGTVFSGWSAEAPRWATTRADCGNRNSFIGTEVGGFGGLSPGGRGNYTRDRAR
jgi:hypothetical protein